MIRNLILVFVNWWPEGVVLFFFTKKSSYIKDTLIHFSLSSKTTYQTTSWQNTCLSVLSKTTNEHFWFATFMVNVWQGLGKANYFVDFQRNPFRGLGDGMFSVLSNSDTLCAQLFSSLSAFAMLQPHATSSFASEREHFQALRWAVLSTTWLIILANIEWIDPNFCKDIHGPRGMNPKDIGYPLTFPLAPPWG